MCDAHEAVKRARHDQRAISVEVYGGDKVEMAVQCLDAFTCIELSIRGHKSLDNTRTFCCIPYSHITVTTSGYKLCALGVVVDTEYIACMSFEHFTRQTLPATVEQRTFVYSNEYIQNRHSIFEWCGHQMLWRGRRCPETMQYPTSPLCAHSNYE